MNEIYEDKPENRKWQALLRGQITAATVAKYSMIMRLIDQKAQVMIFLNSILVPVSIRGIESEVFKQAAMISVTSAVLSITAAMICIYPKRKYRRSGDRELNLLHFNDIGHMERDEYLDMILPVFNEPKKLAETALADLYDTARYSILPKFYWLKISYAAFLLGNLLAIIVAFFNM